MTAHKWFIKMIGTCKNDQSSIYAQARIKWNLYRVLGK
jgi:hypothetical protein